VIVFWLSAALLSAALVGIMLLSAQRARSAPARQDPAVAVYRRQLAEIDALAGRDLVGQGEREAVRAEAGRRLLRAAESGGRPVRQVPEWTAPALAILAPLSATAIYFGLGSPGFPDRSHQARLAEWRAAPERLSPAEAAAVLTDLTRKRPDDPEAYAQLSRARLAAGDAFGAASAAERAAEMQPGDPSRWTGLAQALLALDPPQPSAAGAALDRAEALTPADIDLLYWRGRVAFAQDDAVGGLAVWRSLLLKLPEGDPRRAALERELAVATDSRPEVDAAIESMVAGLAARLREAPLDPEGWVRLVRAYAVMGREAELNAAMAEARRLFSGRPEVLRELDAARAERRARSPLRADG
jgi:cytochrome c-type biogenesis protein CcmH